MHRLICAGSTPTPFRASIKSGASSIFLNGRSCSCIAVCDMSPVSTKVTSPSSFRSTKHEYTVCIFIPRGVFAKLSPLSTIAGPKKTGVIVYNISSPLFEFHDSGLVNHTMLCIKIPNDGDQISCIFTECFFAFINKSQIDFRRQL